MSFYYKQNFVNPEPLFILVKEELKGFMETGAVDDLLFPVWAAQCIRKLGKAAYPINHAMLCIEDYQETLPSDFYAAREVWACSSFSKNYQLPSATYTEISTRIDNQTLYCDIDCTAPDVITAVYKTTNTVAYSWKKVDLLTPGNHDASGCDDDSLYCANYGAKSPSTYDIRDNKLATSFREGKVYMVYYSKDPGNTYQLIPDDFYTQKYVELYLKEKVFEQLSNQSSDEGTKLMQQKYQYYKQLADEAYIIADTNNKKEDVYRKQRAAVRAQKRFDRYNINW